MIDLTVVSATIGGRAGLFGECRDSLAAQTLSVPHEFAYDTLRLGPAQTLNHVVKHRVHTEWFFRLDDDDLVDPDHFEVLSHWLDDDADIVFTWCRIQGGGELHPEDQFQVCWQHEYGWEHLYETNWIPCSAAVRTSLFRDLGGYDEAHEFEDWDLWQRALDEGARFRCVPAVTWTYRMDPAWVHRLPEGP